MSTTRSWRHLRFARSTATSQSLQIAQQGNAGAYPCVLLANDFCRWLDTLRAERTLQFPSIAERDHEVARDRSYASSSERHTLYLNLALHHKSAFTRFRALLSVDLNPLFFFLEVLQKVRQRKNDDLG